jgi:hypothetical protein
VDNLKAKLGKFNSNKGLEGGGKYREGGGPGAIKEERTDDWMYREREGRRKQWEGEGKRKAEYQPIHPQPKHPLPNQLFSLPTHPSMTQPRNLTYNYIRHFQSHWCSHPIGVPAQAIRMLTIEQTERWDMMQANAAAQQVSKQARGQGG